MAVRIATSEWSKLFDIESKEHGVIEMNEEFSEKKRKYQLSIRVSDGPGKFWRTNVITIRPRFIFVNNFSDKIFYRQQGCREAYTLPEGAELPFYWPDRTLPAYISIKIGSGTDWSSGFHLSFGTIWIRMRSISNPGEFQCARVNIKFVDDITTVFFIPQQADMLPYRIQNELTSLPISISQLGTNCVDQIGPGKRIPYTWDNLSIRPLLLKLKIRDTEVELGLEQLGRYPLVVKSSQGSVKVWVELEAEGPIRVLRLRESEKEHAQQNFYDGEDWTMVDTTIQQVQYKLQVILSLESIGISIIDDSPQELLFMSLKQVYIEYGATNEDDTLELKVGSLQMDNQMPNAVYPIAIFHRPPPTGTFFNLRLLRSTKPSSIDHFRYLSLLMHEMFVKLDEVLLLKLARFGIILNDFWRKQIWNRTISTVSQAIDRMTPEDIKRERIDIASLKREDDPSKMVYFELILLNPMRITLSFSNNASISSVRGAFIDETFNTIMSKGFLSVDNAPIELNGLRLENPFTTRRDLLNRLIQHYIENAFDEWHKFIGAADIIGSPISLFESLNVGWHDFFHEPAQGAMISSEDFRKGLAKGTKSLVNNSVSGMMNSTSKLTGTIGQGLTTLAMDRDYSSKHLERRLMKPKSGAEGFVAGAQDLAGGFASGLTGLISNPIKGAAEGGIGGFFKGVAKGITGAAVKPIVGTLDLVSKTSEGIKNRREESINAASGLLPLKRARLPRTFGEDKTLKPYSEATAANQSVVSLIDNGAFALDHFVARIDLTVGALMLTTQSLIFIQSLQSLQSAWVVSINDVRGLQAHPNGILLLVRKNQSKLAFEQNPETRFIGERPLIKSVYKELLAQLKMLKESSKYYVSV
eukprot:TRINITY_DN7393_c0_g1_i1.p1 TRINITY_DN7393_c0_g1~~TRINITY_DN7393_c0_g1_i1.p1  ORF type:complete len:919 (-),score=173.03 TRINITY_DN7393_c0_g1_i1:117-2720(-)